MNWICSDSGWINLDHADSIERSVDGNALVSIGDKLHKADRSPEALIEWLVPVVAATVPMNWLWLGPQGNEMQRYPIIGWRLPRDGHPEPIVPGFAEISDGVIELPNGAGYLDGDVWSKTLVECLDKIKRHRA
jgi:hypothetical protein